MTGTGPTGYKPGNSERFSRPFVKRQEEKRPILPGREEIVCCCF